MKNSLIKSVSAEYSHLPSFLHRYEGGARLKQTVLLVFILMSAVKRQEHAGCEDHKNQNHKPLKGSDYYCRIAIVIIIIYPKQEGWDTRSHGYPPWGLFKKCLCVLTQLFMLH